MNHAGDVHPDMLVILNDNEMSISENVGALNNHLAQVLGFNYIGPVDGHDVIELVKTLKNMRELKGPQFLHIMTKKGKGYEPAEKDPIGYHGVPKFDPSHSSLPKSSSTKPTYSKIFGDFLCDISRKSTHLNTSTWRLLSNMP